MVEIRIYGKLRKKVAEKGAGGVTIVEVEPHEGEQLIEILQRIGIKVEDIFTIFYNAGILATHNTMACFLGYRQACKGVDDWSLAVEVKDGDRIGVFGDDMSALVV